MALCMHKCLLQSLNTILPTNIFQGFAKGLYGRLLIICLIHVTDFSFMNLEIVFQIFNVSLIMYITITLLTKDYSNIFYTLF